MASVDLNQALPPRSTAEGNKPAGSGKALPAANAASDANRTEAAALEGLKRQEAQEQQQQEQKQNLESAVAQLNDYVQSVKRDLHFSLDESSQQTVITVTDANTQEVVRQIPNELALDLARKLNEEEPLRLFSAQV